MRQHSQCRVLVGLTCLAAAPVVAQNLLTNSTFDAGQQLGGWSAYGSGLATDGVRSWAADDAAGAAGSGSAHLTVLGTSAPDAVVGISQCAGVTAGNTYAFYARIRTPLGQLAGDGRLVLEVAFFADTGCVTPLDLAGGQGAVVGTAYPLSDATWYGIPGDAPTVEASLPAPAGAGGAQVRAYLERISGGSLVEANVDVAVFHDATTVPVSLISVSAE